MLMAKWIKEWKLHTNTEHRGCDWRDSYVSGYFSQNQLANSMDASEPLCSLGRDRRLEMSKL